MALIGRLFVIAFAFLAACGQLKSETEKLSVRERQALRAMAMTD